MSATVLVTSAIPVSAAPIKKYDPADAATILPVALNQENNFTLDLSGHGENEKFEECYLLSVNFDAPTIATIDFSMKAFSCNFVGDAYLSVSRTTEFGSDSLMTVFADGSKATTIQAYEPGTYYFQVKLVKDEYVYGETSYAQNPNFSIKLTTRTVARNDGFDGKSTSTAIPTTSGEVSHGLITTEATAQYFAIKCEGKSKVSVDVALADKDILTADANVICKLVNDMGSECAEGVELDCTYGADETSCNITVEGLEKGTYYLVVAHENASYNGNRFASINVKPTVETAKVEQLKAPKLTAYKKGTKVIKGTAVAGSKVTVQVKNFVKTVKANSKGKFQVKLSTALKKGQKIKVKASKTGFKTSKTVTYKVK